MQSNRRTRKPAKLLALALLAAPANECGSTQSIGTEGCPPFNPITVMECDPTERSLFVQLANATGATFPGVDCIGSKRMSGTYASLAIGDHPDTLLIGGSPFSFPGRVVGLPQSEVFSAGLTKLTVGNGAATFTGCHLGAVKHVSVTFAPEVP